MIQHSGKPIPHKPCKFVKVNGRYRFFPVNKSDQHRNAVLHTETAEAAGTLVEYDNDWVMVSDYSSSLRIGCQDVHRRELDALLGKPER